MGERFDLREVLALLAMRGGTLNPRVYKDARRLLCLTQRQLADDLGCAEETVCRWERGHDVPPQMLRHALRAFLTDALGGGPR
jgi:DNA-binding transcriptional regulator YiaG